VLFIQVGGVFSLNLLLFAFQGILTFIVGYQLLLTGAAWRAKRNTPERPFALPTRFFILIPAHNEEKLLPSLLQNLQQLDYPASHYTVHVVADNCTDETAAVAREMGAVVHERTNEDERGKGYALQWLVRRLIQNVQECDAFVILDADTIVSPGFLRVMNARLGHGERVIQAYYAVRDPDRSWSAGLRYAALTVLHYLRPQGRMVLGGSAGLKGNGMVFTADVMKRHVWPASVTEDIELHMALLLDGERVTFAPDAVVWAEMPDTLAGSQSQTDRWEQGRIQMARRYVPRLLQRAWRERGKGRSFLMFDAAMEHIIPPFSILTALSGIGFLVSFLLAGVQFLGRRKKSSERPSERRLSAKKVSISNYLPKVNLFIAFFIVFGQLIYLLSGLRLARAPKNVYTSLLYAPGYVVWKTLQYGRVLFGKKEEEWVRTTRNLK
jgi:cellulose synthase/poly-beta-1,6-N-acetylglucosamine synthase-like glycosyltransferase